MMKSLILPAAALLALGGLYAGATTTGIASAIAQSPDRKPDVIFVPTPHNVVDRMLEMAGVRDGDIVYDLGSGDGRIPITAAQRYNVRAVGIEIDPQRLRAARAAADAAGVADRVSFRQEDLFQADFSEATVVTLYLLQRLNEKLKPRLLSELKPGTRVVSHAFSMGPGWPPERTERVNGSTIYMWTIPERRNPRG